MVRVGTRREQLERRRLEANKRPCCSFRDLISGFGIGLAIAALYVNGKQQPIQINPSSGKATVKSATTSPSTGGSGGKAVEASKVPAIKVPATSTKMIPLVNSKEGRKDFYPIAKKTGTDKVWGPAFLERCTKDPATCPKPNATNPQCKVLQGHFYHTMYNKWLGPYSTDDTEPFQFLEIGFYAGWGFDAFSEFLPRAEMHSIEYACFEPGTKWNPATQNKRYQEYLDTNKLHCGDGSNINFLNKVWTTNMKRPDAPPLKVVIDDASHLAAHQATSLFFWFPRIEPGGIMIIEDVQPIQLANKFRIHALPQIMKDLHYCGDPDFKDKACFPTIWPLLHSVHCEMHICVFERNNEPAKELDLQLSKQPRHALDAAECLFKSSS